jgi:GxxExxY protein
MELGSKAIPYVSQCELQIAYKSKTLRKSYIADLVIEHKIIVEIKAIESLTVIDKAQAINYLKATGMQLALLINFGAKQLEWERIILTQNKK